MISLELLLYSMMHLIISIILNIHTKYTNLDTTCTSSKPYTTQKTVKVQKIAANANDQPSTSFSRIPLTTHTFLITSYDYVYFYLTVFFSIQFYFTTFLLNETTDQHKIKYKNKNTQNIYNKSKTQDSIFEKIQDKIYIYLIESIFN